MEKGNAEHTTDFDPNRFGTLVLSRVVAGTWASAECHGLQCDMHCVIGNVPDGLDL
jgi:hypothetical protein